jgi:Glutathione S-transferase, N-terminal domain
MKLYVCYGTFKFAPRPGGHPCGNAFHALKDAGHDPDVVLSYGWGVLPDVFNRTKGREEVKRLTGNHWVPALVTDDGSVVQGSDKIMAWAREHPAAATAAQTTATQTEAGPAQSGATATAPPPEQPAGTPEAPTGPTTGSE